MVAHSTSAQSTSAQSTSAQLGPTADTVTDRQAPKRQAPDALAPDELVPGGPTEPTALQDVVVIGAGLSGLTLGFRLAPHCAVTVLEAKDAPGGAIATRQRDGFCWEEGPNSFTPAPALLNLIADVGLAPELIWADRKLPRFIYWEGQLLPVPMTPPALLSSTLLTLGAKVRALRGLLGFVGSPPGTEETVRQFFSRQLGPQVMTRLVAPFVSGVYAGDPDQLSAAAAFARVASLESEYGSLIAGLLGKPKAIPPVINEAIAPVPRRGQLGNFRQGMQQLPRALGNALGDRLRLGWQVLSLTPDPEGYLLTCKTAQGVKTLRTRQVVLTGPAYQSAKLLQPLAPTAATHLAAIDYPHVGAVALAYPAESLPQPFAGFGQLFPRGQGVRTLGTIWSSSLFPGRSPEGFHCLLSFIGGATDPDAATLSDSELANAVHLDLSRTLLTRRLDPWVLGVRRWRKAIPQYTLGHQQRIATIQEDLQTLPGLSLCANYLAGVSLGDCVQRAEALVPSILAQLARQL